MDDDRATEHPNLDTQVTHADSSGRTAQNSDVTESLKTV
jgi:hypothetical protein